MSYIPIDARALRDVFDWKDGEYRYCVTLLRTDGNRSVPHDCIPSYFDVQIGDARREGRPDVAAALADVLAQWRAYHGQRGWDPQELHSDGAP